MNRDVARVSTGVGLSMLQELQMLVWSMRWFIALCVVLIVVDLVFGIEKAKVHNEQIRRSRAIRRTINKFIDYMCWLLFAGIFSMAFSVPFGIEPMTVAACAMLIACLSEVDSIYNNYADAHGKERFSITKFLVHIFKRKNSTIGSALENYINESKDEDK